MGAKSNTGCPYLSAAPPYPRPLMREKREIHCQKRQNQCQKHESYCQKREIQYQKRRICRNMGWPTLSRFPLIPGTAVRGSQVLISFLPSVIPLFQRNLQNYAPVGRILHHLSLTLRKCIFRNSSSNIRNQLAETIRMNIITAR